MEGQNAAGGGARRRLCLERHDLSQPVEDRLRDHRHPLEWTEVLWLARSGGLFAMKTGSVKAVRCAIYTRVSTDQGLDQGALDLGRCNANLRTYPSLSKIAFAITGTRW